MKTTAFLTLDWATGTTPLEPNGCAWYRCYLPMKELEKYEWFVGMGIPEYNYQHGFGIYHPEDKTVSYGWDIVVLKLVMLQKALDAVIQYKGKGQKVFVDIDDYYEGLSETNLAHKMTDPERNPENNREIYLKIIDNADGIITSTQFLYDYYKNEKKVKNVFLVRNGIDLDRWKKRKDFAGGLPTIGWVGALPWRSRDLETMSPFFGEFLEKNRLPFHHAGHINKIASATDKLDIPESVKFTHNERMIISKYPNMFRKIDIGIVPLNNIPFNHAKSTIKGLEYAASGIPFVASYSPEYELLASQGVGRVANTPEEWEEHLTELLDPRVRKEESDKNYENVKASHTMLSRGKDWDKTMNAILSL